MIKQHKKMLILTSVITLLPIFIGLLFMETAASFCRNTFWS